MPHIEILADAEADLIESGLIFDPHRHRVIQPSDYADWCNRMTKRTDLFVYFHRVTGAFVLAGWTVPGKACVELTTMDLPPGWFDSMPPCLDIVKALVRPAQEKAQEAVRVLREHRSNVRGAHLDSVLHRKDLGAHLRKNDKPGAASLEAGVPFMGTKEGGDYLAATKDTLVTEAKLAARSEGPWYDHLKPAKPEAPAPSIVLPE